jgi:hypothetical protein
MVGNPHLDGVTVHSFPVLEAATRITSNLNNPDRQAVMAGR